MKNSTFVRKSFFLSLSNMLIGILIFLFSIILTRRIGPEGMGLYGLVFPVSGLLMSVLSGGLMTAVSKTVADLHAKEAHCNLKKTIKVIVLFNILMSIVLVFFALIFSHLIALYLIRDLRVLNALRILFISIIFMTLSNTYKGYFYGFANVTIPILIDVFEKVTRILLILIAFKLLENTSLTTTITIAFGIYCIGEIVSLIFYLIFYKLYVKHLNTTTDEPLKNTILLRNVLTISIPLMLAELLGSSFHTISTLLVPRRLVISGLSYSEALQLIGRFSSMASQIVFFPLLVIGSISTILIPDITSSMIKKDISLVKDRICSVLSFSFLFGVSFFLICQIFGDELGYLIYRRNDLGDYIKFLSFSGPFVYLSASIRSVLNGLGKQKFLLKTSVFFSIIELILLYVLIAIPNINIYGIAYTILFTSFFGLLLNGYEMKKAMNFKWSEWNPFTRVKMAD